MEFRRVLFRSPKPLAARRRRHDQRTQESIGTKYLHPHKGELAFARRIEEPARLPHVVVREVGSVQRNLKLREIGIVEPRQPQHGASAARSEEHTSELQSLMPI